MTFPFAAVLRDVFCALSAYALARWLFGGPGDLASTLPKEMAAFLGFFLALRLVLGLWARSLRQRREARRVAQAIRHTGR